MKMKESKSRERDKKRESKTLLAVKREETSILHCAGIFTLVVVCFKCAKHIDRVYIMFLYHVLLLVLTTALLAGAQQRCNRNEYSCKEGKCISKRFLCDGWQDCQDGADERECVNPCQTNEFRCPNTDICLHESVKCNGDFDCPDGGDELQCDYPLCKADEFQCDNGWCLHKSWMCDGNQDCLGGEDEEQCAKCPSSMFQCAPNSCIPPTLKCNGIKDCENGKDEKANALTTVLALEQIYLKEMRIGSGQCSDSYPIIIIISCRDVVQSSNVDPGSA
eukprot:sb/3468006/